MFYPAPSVKIKPEGPPPILHRDGSEGIVADGADEDPWNRPPQRRIVVPPPAPVLVQDDGTGAGEPDADELQVEELPKEAVDWTSFDLGRALRSLRSTDLKVITRTLRSLHIRWWHASTARMVGILRAAGLSKQVLDAVKPVHDTCRICRQWSKPGARAIATLRLSTAFNECVQCDLLFVSTLIILHLVDEASRWSMCKIA